MADPTVAVLGTGRMGSAMAERLASRGVAVVVYNRSPDRAHALAERIGGRVAGTPAEAAAGADVTISMVADDDAVARAVRRPGWRRRRDPARAVAVECSTVLPDTIRAVAPARCEHAARASSTRPVSGSVALDLTGELTIMVGGEAADLERARPVLDRLARRVFHLGPLGIRGGDEARRQHRDLRAQRGAVAEGLVLAERTGSTARWPTTSSRRAPPGRRSSATSARPSSIPRRRRSAFSLALAEKDLRLIGDLAEASGTAMPQAAVNLQAIRAGGGIDRRRRRFRQVASHLRRGGPAMTDRP